MLKFEFFRRPDLFLLRLCSGLLVAASAEAASPKGMRTAQPALMRAATVLFLHRRDKYLSREAGPHL
jgi:hypothetical protein